MDRTVEDLLAEAAISDIQKRYCRGVDRLDWEMVRACFHPDAMTDYGHYVGGVDGFIEMAEAGLTGFSSTTHFIGNQLVEVEGDAGRAEHYVIAYHRCPADGAIPEHDFICNFRYVDRVEKRDGAWRIARRVLLADSWRHVPLPDFGPGPTMKPGTRDARDLSYSEGFRRIAQ